MTGDPDSRLLYLRTDAVCDFNHVRDQYTLNVRIQISDDKEISLFWIDAGPNSIFDEIESQDTNEG